MTNVIGAMGLALAFTSACGADANTEGGEVVRASVGSPSNGGGADDTPDVIEVTPEKIAKGEEVFNGRCASCHGPGATGKIGMGPALASKSFLEAANDKMLLDTIRQGRPGTTMIPWENAMTPEELEAVGAYIRSTVEHELVELNEEPLKGEAEQGAELYHSICARCHGNSGAGYSESSSGTGIGRKAFLDVASNGYIRHVVQHGKSGTKMRPFADKAPTAVANLNDVEIDSIIAHLRAKAW